MAGRSKDGTSAGLPGGFDPPSSNVTWCPNQFFDVVLPHFPRGVVRIVGYLLWRLPLGKPSARWISWLTLAGMLMPLGILAEVTMGAPPALVLVGGISMVAAMAWFGLAVAVLRPQTLDDSTAKQPPGRDRAN